MSGVNPGNVPLKVLLQKYSGNLIPGMFAYRSILREPPRPTIIREYRRVPWLAVSVVCFGVFMGQLDASIVTITFPAMEREFSVPVAVQWVSLAYLGPGI
jgi:hypothetical protein